MIVQLHRLIVYSTNEDQVRALGAGRGARRGLAAHLSARARLGLRLRPLPATGLELQTNEDHTKFYNSGEDPCKNFGFLSKETKTVTNLA